MSSGVTHNEHDDKKKKREAKGIHPIVFSFALAITLVAGVLAGMYRHQLYATVAPVFGIKASSDSIDTEYLQQVYRQLSANYDGKLDDNALIHGAAKGMVGAAGDAYTMLFDAEEAAQFDSELSGAIGGGIGAQVGLRDNSVTLIKILAGTPAERAGLKAGDRVIAINDESTKGLTVEKAVEKIRGDVGTTVKLRIERPAETKDISVTREEITSPSVTDEIKDGIGIITLTRFDQDSGSLVRSAAERLKAAGVRGVVLDLRGNPGGYLTAARDVASVWLKKGQVVVSEKEGSKVIETLKVRVDPVLDGVKTVVLVDGNSASASEIVAGALQDHKAATLVGETTYGKGSVQRIMPLADGSMLKVTVARWYTPNDKNITKHGIAPDQEVKITEQQLRDGDDVQLRAALDRLK